MSAVLFLCACLLNSPLSAMESKPISFTIENFTVEGDVPIPQAEVDAVLKPYGGGREYDLDGLQKISKRLETVIREQGFAFYRVVVPPQSIKAGRITLKVVGFQVGNIDVKGNRNFTIKNIRNSLPGLVEDQSPNMKTLARELKVANRHPMKETQLTFRQSQEADLVDATLNVQDSKPHQYSLILSNTGSDETGDYRLTGVFQHANLFSRDHVLGLSYTTSPEQTGDVQQAGISYSMPFYNRKAWLSAYFVYSNVDSGTFFDTFEVAGTGQMAGVHWLQSLPAKGRYEHWLDVGLDDRFFDNDVVIIGENDPVVDDIRSQPFSVKYQGEYAWRRARLDFHVQWLKNTEWCSNNSSEDYAGSGGRQGAPANWDAFKFGADISRLIGKWSFATVLEGQLSDEPLISGEQFGVGGSASVRGYEERETSADSGVTIKAELHTPTWKEMILLAFFDYGYADMKNPLPESEANWHLSSWGFGARGKFKRRLFFSVDLAQAFETSPKEYGDTGAGDVKVHATVMMQF